MRNATKWVLSAALLAGLGGCTAFQDFFTASSNKNLPVDLKPIQQSMNVRTKWKVSVGGMDAFVFTPSVSENYIYAASANGNLVKIDARTGEVQWKIDTDMPLTAGVGSSVDTVAVAADKGKVLAYSTDGKLRWTAQASSEVISPPAVAQGLVIVHGVDNRITAFDIETGDRRWVVQRTVPPLTLRVATGITIEGPLAFVAVPGGKLLAIALSNGAPVWEGVVAEPKGTTELERIADTTGFPVVIGGDVCAASYQGRVACFDAAKGIPRWVKPVSSEVGLGADERFIFAADEKGAVTAFSRELGASVWKNDKLGFRRLSTPVSFGRSVAVGDYKGYMHFMSREDGAFIARVETDGSGIASVPLVVNDYLIVQTRSGSVVALAAE